jgi:hypothetical protein
MMGVIALIQWLIANWQIIATAFSSISSIALFFMHGNAKQELGELKDFINSLQISQTQPIDTNSAEVKTLLKDPKK